MQCKVYGISYAYRKAHIPQGIAFALATQRDETNNKQHEIYMANAKYISPARVGGHIRHYRLALGSPGFALGPPGFALGLPGFALGLPGFALGLPGFALGLPGVLDTNMLVSVTQNSCVGGHIQREAPTRVVFALQWNISVRGLPLITYAPRGRRGGGKVSYTFPLRITCKKKGGGERVQIA